MDLVVKNSLLKFKQQALAKAEQELIEAIPLLFEVGKIVLYKKGKRKTEYRGRIMYVYSVLPIPYVEVRLVNGKKIEKVPVKDISEIF